MTEKQAKQPEQAVRCFRPHKNTFLAFPMLKLKVVDRACPAFAAHGPDVYVRGDHILCVEGGSSEHPYTKVVTTWGAYLVEETPSDIYGRMKQLIRLV